MPNPRKLRAFTARALLSTTAMKIFTARQAGLQFIFAAIFALLPATSTATLDNDTLATCQVALTGTPEPHFLPVDTVLKLHSAVLAQEGGGIDGVRDPEALEAAVLNPQATFGGQDLYPTLFDKAASYAFEIAESQAFLDGNKRTAVQAATQFLAANGFYAKDENTFDIFFRAMVDVSKKQLTRDKLDDLLREIFIQKNSTSSSSYLYITEKEALEIHATAMRAAGGQMDHLRNPKAFSSALLLPQSTYAGMDLYPTVYDKAAAYLFFIAEAQAFINGNKRVAIGVALKFLDLNGYKVDPSARELLQQALLDLGNKKVTRRDLVLLFHKIARPGPGPQAQVTDIQRSLGHWVIHTNATVSPPRNLSA